MTPMEQLLKWVDGESVHSDRFGCVPDYSCCCPKLLASPAERKLYEIRPDARPALNNMFDTAALLIGHIQTIGA